jgi:hypothetical protein
MSLQQTVYVDRASVPQRDALQAAIDALGFDCKLDPSFMPFKSAGFLPCVLNGKDSGFEMCFEPAADVIRHFPHLEGTIGSRDTAITFRWGGEMAECACVIIVSAALATSFGAMVHYQDDDMLYSAAQLVAGAGAALQAIKSKRAQPLG